MKSVNMKTNDYQGVVYLDEFNERCKLTEYKGNLEKLLADIKPLCQKYQLTKLIVYGKRDHIKVLHASMFELEAYIKGFFGGEDMFYFCRYFQESRRQTSNWMKEDHILEQINQKKHVKNKSINETSLFPLRQAGPADAGALADLYKEVFKVYPTPLHQEEYIKETMEEGTIYFFVEDKERVISAASAEINSILSNAELTDCATLPEYRTHKLMKFLLRELEKKLVSKGIFNSFSIARADSVGMNAVLSQLNYEYTGRLKNNCYIFENLENMNVWCKDLSDHIC
ncbi:putative beta-lysine N-acetyltransferase [Metabacillus arenae]|uniref:Beta-lysine N-acetyltransferase n=1 Tax=Metabacillus arenae TaxID=2771434 RepID=A0A926RW69_9BACI|nr:putative beta-lysine N-acetyltransferase [Metabacillus arenae]MBD1379250.1 putative beta-lysine N-acetyltransferase [Metabacillus arenae]